MTSRSARLLLAALFPVLLSLARAQPQPAPLPGTSPAGGAAEALVTINLPDADIDTMLGALEQYTGRVILRPAALPTATYNLKITKPIPVSEAILYIKSILALNGIAVTPLGERAYEVVALQNARAFAPELITGSAFDRPASGQIATKLFQLEFARVQEVLPLFQNILNMLTGGPVALPNANAILVTDSISNLQRVEQMLEQVDKPVAAGMKPKFYTLRFAKASDLVTKLRTILTGTLQLQLGSATTYNADDRTNQIVLVTDPRQYPFFDDLIAKLDVKADPNNTLDVIPLNHAKASEVITVLTSIISGQTAAIQRQSTGSVRPGQVGRQLQGPQAPGAPGPQQAQAPAQNAAGPADTLSASGSNEFSSLMTVVNDDRSNSIVVSGTADDIRLITGLINKLDIVLAQVRIEVVIAEVTLEDNDQSGISTLGLVLDGDKLVGFSGAASVNSVVVSNGIITRPGTTGRRDLAAEIAIGTTPRKGSNNIVARPAIVTSHGKEGKIFYGESRPVITASTTVPGSQTGITQQSQITQQEIGTTLTVTPFIGQDGSVQIDIVQDVSDVTGNVTVDGNTQYIIGKRSSTSYVSAKTGDILVLGGFDKTSDIASTRRLGPIPFLGDLFGERTKNKRRQELLFFLRPTVLTNNPTQDNAEAMKRIEELPIRDQVKQQFDPNYQPPVGLQIDRSRP